MHHSEYLSILSDLPSPFKRIARILLFTLTKNCHDTRKFFTGGDSWIKNASIQEFVPGKQVTLAHLIAHPGEELAKKISIAIGSNWHYDANSRRNGDDRRNLHAESR